MILGVTGTNASGKGLFCSILKEKLGFTVFSLADILREEATSRGMEHSTRNLIAIGNEFREKYGPSILAKRIKKKILDENVIIDSIRNPSEVEELRQLPNFILIAVDAPLKLRYERECLRGRTGNAKSFEEWMSIETIEDDVNPLHLQVHVCIKMADYVVMNEGTKEQLMQQIEKLLEVIKKRQELSHENVVQI